MTPKRPCKHPRCLLSWLCSLGSDFFYPGLSDCMGISSSSVSVCSCVAYPKYIYSLHGAPSSNNWNPRSATFYTTQGVLAELGRWTGSLALATPPTQPRTQASERTIIVTMVPLHKQIYTNILTPFQSVLIIWSLFMSFKPFVMNIGWPMALTLDFQGQVLK